MKRYVLTADAEKDLAKIVDQIAEYRPLAALRIFDELHATMRRLSEFPGI